MALAERSNDRRTAVEGGRTRSLIDDSVQLCTQFFNETGGKTTMTKEQFIRATGCKSEIFGCKLFETLDSNNSGYVTVDDFLEGFTKLRAFDAMERIRFVFSIFDLDGDGTITKEELKTVICASVEESDNQMTEEETAQFVSALLQVFDSDGNDNISLEGFANVLRNYPGLLSGLTFGTFGTLASANAKDRQSQKKKSFRRVRKMASWVINNPQRLFTYTTVSLALIGCFLWRFLRYSENCDGVDMDLEDPLTGYSRSYLKEELSNQTTVFEDEDFNYMVFSKRMAEMDPIECRDARKRKLFSWTLPIAKGCGQAMKATFTLILFPVSRNLMTTLRETFLKYIFPFDRAIEFHKFLGRVGFWLAWTHVICHIVDIKNWTDPDRFNHWSWAFPDDRTVDEVQGCVRDESGAPVYHQDGRMIPDGELGDDGIPRLLLNVEHQPTLRDILSSAVAITGIILIVVYTIAALFAFDYPKKLKIFKKTEAEKRGEISKFRSLVLAIGRVLNDFNYFWYSHHLFGVFYIALLCHPLPALPDERNEWAVSDSWLWVGIPALIYLIERALRVKRSSGRTRVVGADILPGDVVGLKVRRPRWFNYTPGQYVFIKCPQISRFEWHPFTLTSCPGDSYLGVHVRKAGDWTSALHSIVRDYHTNREMNMLRNVEPATILQNQSTYIVKPVVGEESEVVERFPFNILVDGPFGAPAQDHGDYRVIVLIGAGIGVTPFASVLTDLLDSLRKCTCARCGYINPEQLCSRIRKVYFYWTVRSRSEASWFKHLLEAIALREEEGLLDINIHITGIKGANDLRTMMLSLAQYECAEEAGSDFHSRAVTHFGRINMNRVFEKVKSEFPHESHVGVFYCGPNTIAKSLDKLCRLHSRGQTKFSFMKESFG